ncbi:MAG: response regulator [Candidatus Devosia phytovorans]|uniref:Response regulator n=1 Tax=Candidatus Devosia phytovorans TaxID=3121372 RepID=A0AAJ6AZ23_9HYPH|nr:response regulator [Devosia sp.]WEK03652.1 MAG: response regulator [Devosia sp.]
MSKILIVEDDVAMASSLKALLEARGHRVIGPAMDCSSALELLWREPPDLAFVDTHLGSETCEVVLEECDQQMVPVIIAATEGDGLPEFCGVRRRVFKPMSDSAVDRAMVG